MSNLYWLREAQMERLRPYFPKSRGRARVDDRRILSAIIFINRNVVLSRFSSGLFRAMFAMKEIKNGKEIHRRFSA